MSVSREPDRHSPDAALSARMSRLPRRDTKPEIALRSQLHRRGLRYRVHFPVPSNRRRTIDIAFTRVRLAVFVDGCFWHGCPQHGVRPATNADWWRWKLERTRERDRDTTVTLEEAGWTVLRVWEHESAGDAARRVTGTLAALRGPDLA